MSVKIKSEEQVTMKFWVFVIKKSVEDFYQI